MILAMLTPMKNMLISMLAEAVEFLPHFLYAAALLLAGLVIAKLLRAGLVRLLNAIRLDEAIRQWGAQFDGSLTEWLGRLMYWLILAGALLASGSALAQPIITDPLREMMLLVLSYLPNVLGAMLILFAGWVVASVLRVGVGKGLQAVGFDNRMLTHVGQELGNVTPSEAVSAIVFWSILLLAIPPTLGVLALSPLTDPLKEILIRMLNTLPNIIGALLVLFVGWLVAQVVRGIIVNLLVVLGLDHRVRTIGWIEGLGPHQVSEAIGTIIYAVMMIPIFIAALETLDIPAVSKPAQEMLSLITRVLPGAAAALVIIIAAVIIGRLLMRFITTLLTGIGFDAMLGRVGVTTVGGDGRTPSQLVGVFVMIGMIFLAILEAARVLQLEIAADLVSQLFGFATRVLFGLVVLGLGIYVGDYAKRLVRGTVRDWPFLGSLAKSAIIVFALVLALERVGIANEFLVVGFGLVLGTLCLGAALAFGLGARDVAGRQIEHWIKRFETRRSRPAERMQGIGVRGQESEVGEKAVTSDE
ncbi:MAG: mechanosensitive ion channel [Candidatus Latescibacteria bacterium]|nr:mechanosensitive ion channel [Candidatus Latescibacterota bacterium]